MQTLKSSSRQFTLPDYARDGFKPLRTPNYAKNVTLGGTLYVDFYNERRGWELSFDTIDRSVYSQLEEIYKDQFREEDFLLFSDTDLGIVDVPVFLNLPESPDLAWNKTTYRDVKITLERRFAIGFGGS
jgi:hypothetical protein